MFCNQTLIQLNSILPLVMASLSFVLISGTWPPREAALGIEALTKCPQRATVQQVIHYCTYSRYSAINFNISTETEFGSAMLLLANRGQCDVTSVLSPSLTKSTTIQCGQILVWWISLYCFQPCQIHFGMILC
ncbi:hypothetical protein JZ751_014315 [Albula glossodonta]|uniref:Uncharacterized protein n=1 Tax=Albula glossodonta TaxID=121402 RepID=A0A8T2NT37_9TELE|nr:hypothetical protein JZ751_014315 [Albula glossodonta]